MVLVISNSVVRATMIAVATHSAMISMTSPSHTIREAKATTLPLLVAAAVVASEASSRCPTSVVTIAAPAGSMTSFLEIVEVMAVDSKDHNTIKGLVAEVEIISD